MGSSLYAEDKLRVKPKATCKEFLIINTRNVHQNRLYFLNKKDSLRKILDRPVFINLKDYPSTQMKIKQELSKINSNKQNAENYIKIIIQKTTTMTSVDMARFRDSLKEKISVQHFVKNKLIKESHPKSIDEIKSQVLLKNENLHKISPKGPVILNLRDYPSIQKKINQGNSGIKKKNKKNKKKEKKENAGGYINVTYSSSRTITSPDKEFFKNSLNNKITVQYFVKNKLIKELYPNSINEIKGLLDYEREFVKISKDNFFAVKK